MNNITIFLWIAIALVGVFAIIVIKRFYSDNNEETDVELDDISKKMLNNSKSLIKDNIENQKKNLTPPPNLKNDIKFKTEVEESPEKDDNTAPDVEKNNLKNYDYENQNKVLINYNNKVKKFQEPIKQSQMDIMSQIRKNRDESELKDLFTIDELIKESKRKDSQREKESKTISKKDNDDKEIDDLKESIKNKSDEPLIEDLLKQPEKEDKKEEPQTVQSSLTQEDIDNAISIASKEKTPEPPKKDDITNVLLNEEKKSQTETQLHAPKKIVDKPQTTEVPVEEDNIEEKMDLDYRKDIDKFTNKIKGSKIYQEFREKITHDEEEYPPQDDFIKNVNDYDDYNDYDEFEPIINETHIDYEENYRNQEEERLREENTKKIFNSESKNLNPYKSGSEKDNIKIKLNSNDVILKKGDEIIFNHLGETYSSQVYAINGDDISVKYRRKNIKIKPKDVKKIY